MPTFIKEDNDSFLKNDTIIDKNTIAAIKDKIAQYKTRFGDDNSDLRRLIGLTSPEYNKRGDVKYDENGNVHVSTSMMKRIKHDFDNKIPNDKDSKKRMANGGDVVQNLANRVVSQQRSANKKVEAVPEVKPLTPKMSTIDNDNTKISKPKQVHLEHRQLSILKEYYDQLTIPYDNKYHNVNGKNIPLKKNYEYYIDWLESIGKYGTLDYDEDIDINELLYNKLNDTNFIIDTIDDFSYEQDLTDILLSKINELINQYGEDEVFNSYIDLEDYLNNHSFQNIFNDNILTIKTKQLILPILKDFLIDQAYCNGFLSDVETNHGLIYIERNITVPNPLEYHEDTPYTDEYHRMKKIYDGLGVCWTWKKNNGEAYCGDTGYNICFKGYVRQSDIDWDLTLLLNCYLANCECEIRLKPNAIIQLNEIQIQDESLEDNNLKSFPLKKPILVSA